MTTTDRRPRSAPHGLNLYPRNFWMTRWCGSRAAEAGWRGLQAVHRQHNTAADAAGLSPRGGCRAACAQLPEGPGASTSRVVDRGWCFGTVAWFKSLCVWAARAHQRAGSPGGGAATAASLPGWAARPTTVVSSGVLVGLGACALQPHGLSGSRVGGASDDEGAVVAAGGLGFGVGRVTGPSSRATGNCET